MSPRRAIRDVIAGFALPAEAARLLLRERALWPLALVPCLLSASACGLVLAFVIARASAIFGFATSWQPALEVTHWLHWIWIGPALVALKAIGIALFVAIAGAMLVLATLLASLLASPFQDALSRRVEALLRGEVRESEEGSLRSAGRAVVEEARRLLFFLGIVGLLSAPGILLPGAQVFTAPAVLAFTLLYLPLEYASHTHDRRGLSFARKRAWVLGHRLVMGGFGVAAFLACSVPGLNFAAMPVLAVAGTLLALRYPEAEVGSAS